MVFIVSHASAALGRLVHNEDLSQFAKVALPIIEKKTGVCSRYKVDDNILTSDVATEAARRCLDSAALKGKIGALIVATSTPDRLIPATATKVAYNLGLGDTFAFDVNSVCSGSCLLLQQAQSMISGGFCKNVLVVAADCYSKILNPNDFSTFPYFGDGGAAALLSCETESNLELLTGIFHSDGSQYDTVTVKAGAGEFPAHKNPNPTDCYFSMNGRNVFEFATSKVPNLIFEIMDRYSLSSADISEVILHQANINIINSIADSTKIEREKFFVNLNKYGNMAGASVLFALDEYLRSNKSKSASNIITCSFGGGLSWGANLIRVH